MAIVTVLGTGRMGAPIARRLLAAGHRVTVWNRTASRAAPLVEAGARPAECPQAAVRNAEVVITMLTDAAAVDAVLFAAGGAAGALEPGTCLVDMSTIGPAAVRDLARRLPPGVMLVDAPVKGSVGSAEEGTLTVLVGGEDSAVDRVTPILQVLGAVRRCGGPGSGAALKVVLNTALLTAMAAFADTLAVAEALGVDHGTALEAVRVSPLGGALDRATATGASFPIALAGKDLDLALSHSDGATARVVRAAAQVLRAAPDQSADIAALMGRN
jgi:3-hydroxyisobutyrate dehydrogenase-like beta-hydroxyacid dehydrogenase